MFFIIAEYIRNLYKKHDSVFYNNHDGLAYSVNIQIQFSTQEEIDDLV
jgi:hypothetical protein